MYSLKELKADLLWNVSDGGGYRMGCPSLAQAQGIMFRCPLCYKNHGDTIEGTHLIVCWFNGRGVNDSVDPGPGRWNPSGTSIDDLTFVAPGAFSVLIPDGCGWHGYVRDGHATLC